MEWNVFCYNINKKKIETFNIFEHWSFREYARKAAKIYKTKEEFVEQLKSELLYYFWCKAEYELIIEITEDDSIFLIPWCGCRNPEEVKIDVTDDTNFDWKDFANEHIKKQRYDNKAKVDIYDQVMWNWNAFIDYCWFNKKELIQGE